MSTLNTIDTTAQHTNAYINQSSNANTTGSVSGGNAEQEIEKRVQERLAQLGVKKEEQPWISDTVKMSLSSKPLSAEEVKNMSIDELILRVMMDRHDTMRNLVEMQIKKVHTMNLQQRALGELKGMVAAYGSRTSSDKMDIDIGNTAGKSGSTISDMIAAADKAGIKLDLHYQPKLDANARVTTYVTSANELQKFATNIDTNIQSATNIQNSDTTRLQDYIQKMTGALELATNLLKKFSDNKSGTIANMR